MLESLVLYKPLIIKMLNPDNSTHRYDMPACSSAYTRGYAQLLGFLFCCFSSLQGFTQVQWQVQSPVANATVPNVDVFVSVSINSQYNIAAIELSRVFLDDKPALGNLKIINNELYFVFQNPVPAGKHELRIEVYVEELKKVFKTQWSFFAGSSKSSTTAVQTTTPAIGLKGNIVIDNRTESLSGPGQALRQEPNYTRTVSIDGSVLYKNAEMPVRIFITSNSRLAQQTMNFFQLGYKNKWLTVETGDINPNFDRLVLTGVRVRGVKLKFKYRANSLQLCYGELNHAYEGTVLPYIPGGGVLPTNLLNDSQYVAPGIYKRTLAAARIETGDIHEKVQIGLTAIKAKDHINSISYGLAPKENIAGGVDLGLKLFRKRVNLLSGVALSVLTNDISNGPLDKETLDTTYNIKLDFNPKDYENIIVLNGSTIPTSFDNTDFLSYYSQLNYADKYQRFSIEYKKVGGLYASLGNPFQRTNYQGILASERFYLLKKKVAVGLVYQNATNNLNGSFASKVLTQSYRGNVLLNVDPKWPSVYLNYMTQSRNSKSDIIGFPVTKDVLNSFMVNLGLDRSFWNMNHHFFIMAGINKRNDKAQNRYGFSSFTTTIGINEAFSEKLNVNAEVGKVLLTDGLGSSVSNTNIYSAGLDWQIVPAKYFASASLSNNKTFATLLSNESYRISAIGRFRYMFGRGMELLLEGGLQPFRDQTMNVNNYNEAYMYIRYSCDVGQLFTGR